MLSFSPKFEKAHTFGVLSLYLMNNVFPASSWIQYTIYGEFPPIPQACPESIPTVPQQPLRSHNVYRIMVTVAFRIQLPFSSVHLPLHSLLTTPVAYVTMPPGDAFRKYHASYLLGFSDSLLGTATEPLPYTLYRYSVSVPP